MTAGMVLSHVQRCNRLELHGYARTSPAGSFPPNGYQGTEV